jgi:hypothetical protein
VFTFFLRCFFIYFQILPKSSALDKTN